MGKYYGYIYETKNLINGKVYVGQHKVDDDKQDMSYYGSGSAISNAINKYGKENFQCIVLEWARTQEQLNDLEIKYVDDYKERLGDGCYNIAGGGYDNPLKYKNEEEKKIIFKKESETKRERFANLSEDEYEEYCKKRKEDSNRPEVRANMRSGQVRYHKNMTESEREEYLLRKQKVVLENIDKLSKGKKKYYDSMTEEEHRKRSAIQKEISNRPVVKEKNRNAQKQRYANMTEEEREQFRQRQKESANNPKTRKRMSESNKAYWNNMSEEGYKAFCERRKKQANDPNTREKNSKAKKEFYANMTEEEKAFLKEQRKEIANRPNVKRKISMTLSVKPLIITFENGTQEEFKNTVECEKRFKGCSNGLFGINARRESVSKKSKLYILYKIVKIEYANKKEQD